MGKSNPAPASTHAPGLTHWSYALNLVLVAILLRVYLLKTGDTTVWSNSTNPTGATDGYNWTMWHDMRQSRVTEKSYAEFKQMADADVYRAVFTNCVPMVIRGGAASLVQDAKAWSSANLLRKHGKSKVTVSYSPDPYFQRPMLGAVTHPAQEPTSLDVALGAILIAHREKMKGAEPKEFMAIQHSPLQFQKRRQQHDRSSVPQFVSPFGLNLTLPLWGYLYPNLETENLWICSEGKVSVLHNDWRDNILVQVAGTKRITLVDPFRTHAVYPAKFNVRNWIRRGKGKFEAGEPFAHVVDNFPLVNLTRPDLDRFPKFKQANPLTVELRPGDILIMPAYWFHQVENHGREADGLNIAFNYWFRCNAFVTRSWKSLAGNVFRDCVTQVCNDV